MKTILLRADDLGYSEAVNYGIAKTVNEGLIKNVGLMTNMPYAKHGFELLNKAICVGQHTNICVGRPLTDPALIPSIVDEKGYFKTSKEYRTTTKDFVNLNEVMIEIEAQYHAFIAITGLKPQYFEGHAVVSDNFIKGLKLIAKKYNLKFSGFPDDENCLEINGKRVHTSMPFGNMNYDPLESFINVVTNAKENEIHMFVTHPGYLDDYILQHSSLTIPRTKEVEMLCSNDLMEFIQHNDVNLITYNDL